MFARDHVVEVLTGHVDFTAHERVVDRVERADFFLTQNSRQMYVTLAVEVLVLSRRDEVAVAVAGAHEAKVVAAPLFSPTFLA